MLIALFALVVVFADFIAPYNHSAQSRQSVSAPATSIRFRDAEGATHARPFIYSRRLADPLMLRYEEVETERFPIGLFVIAIRFIVRGLLVIGGHASVDSDEAEDWAERKEPVKPAEAA